MFSFVKSPSSRTAMLVFEQGDLPSKIDKVKNLTHLLGQ